MADGLMNKIVGLAVAGIIAAVLLPVALTQLSNLTAYNTTTWGATLTIYNLLPVMLILAAILGFVAYIKLRQ